MTDKFKNTDVCDVCSNTGAWHRQHRPRHQFRMRKRIPPAVPPITKFVGTSAPWFDIVSGHASVKVTKEEFREMDVLGLKTPPRHRVLITYHCNNGEPRTETAFLERADGGHWFDIETVYLKVISMLLAQLDTRPMVSKEEVSDWVEAFVKESRLHGITSVGGMLRDSFRRNFL